MRIEHVALLSAVAVGAVACATGTGDVTGVSMLGNGGASADGGALEPEAGAGGSSPTGTGGAPSDTAPTGSGGSVTDAGPAASFASSSPPAMTTEVPGSYVMSLACSDIPILDVCVLSQEGDQDVPFTLPPGTQRSSILYTITPAGPSASGTVDFASSDPEDGTVHVHGYAGPLSSVTIRVTGVMAIAE